MGRIITLVGADGAGKTTLAERLCSMLGGNARRVYLGSDPDELTHALPTTRALYALRSLLTFERRGAPEPGDLRRPASGRGRLLQHIESVARLALRLSEDLHRLLAAEILELRGYIVILDRHPYLDYHARRARGVVGWQRLGDRVHGWLIRRIYPRPGPVVLLDAPPEVLYARKPEGRLHAIAACREEHLSLAEELDDIVVLDASLPEDDVFAMFLYVVLRCTARRGAAPSFIARNRHMTASSGSPDPTPSARYSAAGFEV